MIIGNTEYFLKQFGGFENNSLINTLQTYEDEDENQIEMQIIMTVIMILCNHWQRHKLNLIYLAQIFNTKGLSLMNSNF